jgi:hypothetical protein
MFGMRRLRTLCSGLISSKIAVSSISANLGAEAREVLAWYLAIRCELAHAFLWEHRFKRLKLAQLLGQLGVFLTLVPSGFAATEGAHTPGQDGRRTPIPPARICGVRKKTPEGFPVRGRQAWGSGEPPDPNRSSPAANFFVAIGPCQRSTSGSWMRRRRRRRGCSR